MDDFQVSTLNDTRNEYSALLVSKLTPYIIQGIYSIFKEAVRLCQDNDELEKYLMTFQNFLGRVTKWNQEIVNQETERIIKQSNCNYLEDLLTCVHVTQLKLLTSIRVGNKQKKIDIDIPKLNDFIHRVYIDVARRVYKNVYLFEIEATPLQKQKNMRECELIVKESILNVIRENMPVETILRTYLDETVEDDVEEVREEVREEVVENTDYHETETQPETKTEEKDTQQGGVIEHAPAPAPAPEPEPEPEPEFTTSTFIQEPIKVPTPTPIEQPQTVSITEPQLQDVSIPQPEPQPEPQYQPQPPRNELQSVSPVVTDVDTDYESDGFVPLKIMSGGENETSSMPNFEIESLDAPINLETDNLLEEIEILA